MKQSKFLTSLRWELRNLFRFPFPEVLLAFFSYMIFLPSGWGFEASVSYENLAWEEITRKIAFFTTRHAALFSVRAYIPMAIFASIFATLVFADEIENGLMKVHLSHPISRRSIFLAKLSSTFLVVFLTLSASLLSATFLLIPENNLPVILSADLVFGVLVVAALQTLFMISVTVCFSLFSGKASVSLIGSFATIYLIQLLSETGGLEFLPPTSFREQVFFVFSRIPPDLSELPGFLIIPIVSLGLIALSFLFFSRRLEIG